MPNALQLGQRQLPLQKVLQHLTTSPSLFQYLRLSIIEETLIHWQQSPEYQTVYSEVELNELYGQISHLAKLPQANPSQIEAFKRSLTLKKYQQVQWGHRIPSYFLVRKRSLDRAIFSAIQVDNLGMAQELYLRVNDRRQSFDKLARLYSQGAEAKLGGVMGPIPVERIHPQIAYHLSSLKPGELSPLFEIDNFHVFVRLERWLPAKFDDDIKGRLMEELFEQWLHAEISNRISTLQVAELGMLPKHIEAIDIGEDRQVQLADAGSERLHHQLPALAQSQAAIVEPQSSTAHTEPTATLSQQPLAKIDAGISFFPPTAAEVPARLETIDRSSSKETTSATLDISTPTTIAVELKLAQPITSQQQWLSQICRQIVAFSVFFTLFLGGGFGAIYLLNQVVSTNGIQVTPHK